MSDTTKNSLSTVLSQFIRLNRNALEIFERINEAVTSTKENVDVDLFDDDNNLKRVQIPSFGYLKNEIARLDRNVSNLSGVGQADTNVRLSDGTFKRVITSAIKSPANDIVNLASPTEFESKNNWFFEDFLNPLLYITFDVSGQIPVDTERILTKKYILQLDTEGKKRFFNENFKDRSDLDFVEFNNLLLDQNIQYILDDDIRDVPPREIKFTGTFDILSIGDSETVELVDGSEIKRRRKTYKLGKLTYTDLEAGFQDTVSLKVGDSLVVNSDPIDTRYIVKAIDSSTNTVELELVEGYRGLAIGADILKINRGADSNIELQVPISFDKYLVIFIKAVDPVSKIPAENWSPGIGFYTNGLILQSDDDEVVTLDTYYRNEVTDFGLFIMSLAKDRLQPSILAIKPNAPEFVTEDLKVVQVNNHITDNPAFKELKQLSDDRNRLVSEIKEFDSAISKKKTTINTKQYNSVIERDKDRSELNSLIEQRSSSAKLLSSIVADIEAKSKSEDLINAKAKYRVRGFVPLPSAQTSKYSGDQEIIGLEVQYRYIGLDGNANKVEQFSHADTEGTSRLAAQSNWVKAPIIVRERIINDETGEYSWADQNIEDPEEININQIDIPIQQGEGIEVRVKSISEAGYPSNPVKSDWSEIVRIDFPDDLIQTDTTEKILEENAKESQRIKLEEDLEAKGINTHISDQFTANEKFFAHTANTIASGDLTTEQTPISLFDKLQDLTLRIRQLEEVLNRAKGELRVKLLDENGNETVIEKDTLTKKFAGYYEDLVKDLDVKKGAIIAKTFFITLENTAATTLELISRTPGDRTLLTFGSGGQFGSVTVDPTIANDSYLVNRAKYDYVPLVYTNPLDTLPDYVNNAPYQSGQLRGQYLYGRFSNVAGTDQFYIDFDVDVPASTITSVDDAERRYDGTIYGTLGNTVTDFIWAGTYSGVTPQVTTLAAASADYDANSIILLHIEHPLVAVQNKLAADINTDRDVIIAKTANLKAEDSSGKKQTGYFFDGNRTVKAAFDPDDQYTLGRASVGSYLFIAPTDEEILQVNGDDSLSIKKIEFGPNKAIQIPITFQYRMTDYGGVGNTGIGFIGGDRTGATKDLTYAKQIGFDVITYDGTNETRFSFDLEIFAKYRSNKLNLEKIPVRDISLAIGDLVNLGNTSPNVGNIS